MENQCKDYMRDRSDSVSHNTPRWVLLHTTPRPSEIPLLETRYDHFSRLSSLTAPRRTEHGLGEEDAPVGCKRRRACPTLTCLYKSCHAAPTSLSLRSETGEYQGRERTA